jgi:hypothetical protein
MNMATPTVRIADDRPVSDAVVEAVAAAAGVDPLELDVMLYEVVDPDALDRLFAGDRPTRGRIEFEMADFAVTVDAGRRVVVHPRTDQPVGDRSNATVCE